MAQRAESDSIRVGVTMGDPLGIGPEVILKALDQGFEDLEVVVFGSGEALVREAQALFKGEKASDILAGVDVVEVAPELSWEGRKAAGASKIAARLQFRALEGAMEACQSEEVDAISTGPWNKALFAEIDRPVEGHTEVLTRFFGARDVVMVLGGQRLRVALVTTHIGLGEVSGQLSARALRATFETTVEGLQKDWGIARPQVAVCGLNPHAGEGGHMGREEIETIAPAVDAFNEQWNGKAELIGPLPSDTLFAGYRQGEAPYDAVVCMYHDQGLIPLKLLHFGESANFTLGLPVVRTSVDHGTAYDIAGRGVADEGSMIYAIEEAARMVRCRRRWRGDGP